MTAHLYKMLSIAEANEIVQGSISALDGMEVDLINATGYVLAEDIKAREPLPPFPASIKVSSSVHQAPTPKSWCSATYCNSNAITCVRAAGNIALQQGKSPSRHAGWLRCPLS